MTGAADDHPPIAPPDTRPVPSGWVMLAKAFTSVAYIVDDPEEAAHELRRALLAGRVHCLRRRFFEAGIEDATLSRTFWRGIKFYAAKDGRGWDILQIRTWLTKGADDSFISKCVLYVWRADINAIWPSAVPDETGLELVGSEPIVTTQVLKHTEAAPIESLKPAEPEAEPSKLVGTTPIIDQAAQSQTAKRAGRPSSKQLMLQRAEERALEHQRRPRSQIHALPQKRDTFLQELSDWLRETHPHAKPMKPKTIGDHLRTNERIRAHLPQKWFRRR